MPKASTKRLTDAARPHTDFCIEIDFEKGSGSPSRVFRAMSDLVDALQDTDRILANRLDVKLEPVLLLEDIETGSLKAWFKQALESVNDSALESGDYKKVVGTYLVKGKYVLINFLDQKTSISDQDLSHLQNALTDVINETDVGHLLPAYEPPSREQIVHSLERINNALAPLNDDDAAKFVSIEGEANFNLTLHIAPETVSDLITAETIESVSTMILKVKKPDFLGTSQWEFRWDNRTLSATILDTVWLGQYQDGQLMLNPGDAVRADVLTQVRYGYDREVVSTHYALIKVLDVINRDNPQQTRLFSKKDQKQLGEQGRSDEAD